MHPDRLISGMGLLDQQVDEPPISFREAMLGELGRGYPAESLMLFRHGAGVEWMTEPEMQVDDPVCVFKRGIQQQSHRCHRES